jgi:hypothetical protein
MKILATAQGDRYLVETSKAAWGVIVDLNVEQPMTFALPIGSLLNHSFDRWQEYKGGDPREQEVLKIANVPPYQRQRDQP